MERREFLISAAAASGVLGLRPAWAQGVKADKRKLDRIAIMTLNFQRLLKLPDVSDEPTRTLELFDLPEMVADRGLPALQLAGSGQHDLFPRRAILDRELSALQHHFVNPREPLGGSRIEHQESRFDS